MQRRIPKQLAQGFKDAYAKSDHIIFAYADDVGMSFKAIRPKDSVPDSNDGKPLIGVVDLESGEIWGTNEPAPVVVSKTAPKKDHAERLVGVLVGLAEVVVKIVAVGAILFLTIALMIPGGATGERRGHGHGR